MNTPHILITGANGTTGRAVLLQLSALQISSRAMVRDLAKLDSPQFPHTELIQGDLSDEESLIAPIAGIDVVYLVVVPGPDMLHCVKTTIAAAKAAKVKRIVKLSAIFAAPDSPSTFIRLHCEADEMLRHSGIGYTIVRPNSFHQNMIGQIVAIKATGAFYLPMGDARQSFIDVEDIASVVVAALTDPAHDGQTYDLSGPEGLSLHNVAEILTMAMKRPVTYVPITNEQFVETLERYGTPIAAANYIGEMFAAFATGEFASVTPDVANIIGRPALSFTEFAGRNLA
jgi:uncharacterized protein YbjT (DUF2867 family)